MCRLALFIGDVQFTDKRCGRDEFAALKADGEFPFGSVPVLYVEEEPGQVTRPRFLSALACVRFCE